MSRVSSAIHRRSAIDREARFEAGSRFLKLDCFLGVIRYTPARVINASKLFGSALCRCRAPGASIEFDFRLHTVDMKSVYQDTHLFENVNNMKTVYGTIVLVATHSLGER